MLFKAKFHLKIWDQLAKNNRKIKFLKNTLKKKNKTKVKYHNLN